MDHEELSPSDASSPEPSTGGAGHEEPADPSTTGRRDELRDILSNVEQQLEHFRELQRTHDEQSLSLADREERLEQANQTLQTQRHELDEQMRSLDGARQRLDEDRDQIDTDRQRLENAHRQLADNQATLEAEQGRLTDERASLEEERRQVQGMYDEELAAIQTREQAVAGREQTLEEGERDLRTRVEALAERMQTLEASEERFQQERASAESTFAERARGIEAKAEKYERAEGELEREREALAERAGQFEIEQAKLRAHAGVAEAQVAELTTRIEQVTADAEAAQAQLRERSAAEVETLNQRLAESEARAATAKRRAEEEAAERQGLQRDRETTQSELSGARAALEAAQTDCDAVGHDLESMRAELEAARVDLETTRNQRDEAVARAETIHQEIKELRQSETTLAERLGQREHEQEQLRTRIRDVEAGIDQYETTIRDQAARLEQAEHAAVELAQVSEQLDERDAELQQLRTESEASSSAAKQRTSQLEAELARGRGELERQQVVLADHVERLERAEEKIQQVNGMLEKQAPELERGAAAQAMVEEQNQQIERLTSQLAKLNLDGDVELSRRKDERIAELTEALHQARGQTVGDVDVAGLENRISQLSAEVDRHRMEAEQATLEAAEAKRNIETQINASAAEGVLREQLAQRDREVDELETRVADIQAKVDEYQTREIAVEPAVDPAQIAELEQRIEHLTAELELAQAQAADADAGEPSADLREKATRIAIVAEHLRRRRARLDLMRRAIRGRRMTTGATPSIDMEGHATRMRDMDRRTQELEDLRDVLAKAERRMVRRWARPRAVFTVAWLMALLVISAALSLFAADQLFPAVMSGSVTLEAKAQQRGRLDDEDRLQWKQWHTELLADETFRKALARRMEERRLDAYGSFSALGGRLEEDLTVDASQPGRMTLTLAGTDPDEVAAFLDILATTVASESGRRLRQQTDTPISVVRGERSENGRVRYATMNPTSIRDERLRYAGPIFGVVFGVLLVSIIFVYVRLIRAKREFDDDGTIFAEAPRAAA